MINSELELLLMKQVAHELLNSNKYRVCKSWLRKEGYEGLSKFFDSNYKDELSHAEMIQSFIEDRNCLVNIPAIEEVSVKFNTVLDIALFAMDTEVDTTRKLSDIMIMAQECNDFMCQELMFRMLKEQVEEEDKIQTLIDRVMKAEDENNMLVVDTIYGG